MLYSHLQGTAEGDPVSDKEDSQLSAPKLARKKVRGSRVVSTKAEKAGRKRTRKP